MKNKEENRIFTTQDISLTALLRYCKFKVEEVKFDGGKAIFVFKDNEELRQAVRNYYSGEEKVIAKDFINTLRETKSMIFNLR